MSDKRLRDVIFIALTAALTVICAYISIPAAVPFTMQTFAIFFALNFLGAKKGTICILLYLSLGSIGLPVFAGGNAGVGTLFGTTGGYMIGWIIAGLAAWLAELILGRKLWAQTISALLGLIICYTVGTAWLVLMYTDMTSGVWNAILTFVIPFIIPDIIKIGLAVFIGNRLKAAIKI